MRYLLDTNIISDAIKPTPSEDGPEATKLRAMVARSVAGEQPRKGGILAALRRSPLVGADLDLTRPRTTGRKIEL